MPASQAGRNPSSKWGRPWWPPRLQRGWTQGQPTRQMHCCLGLRGVQDGQRDIAVCSLHSQGALSTPPMHILCICSLVLIFPFSAQQNKTEKQAPWARTCISYLLVSILRMINLSALDNSSRARELTSTHTHSCIYRNHARTHSHACPNTCMHTHSYTYSIHTQIDTQISTYTHSHPCLHKFIYHSYKHPHAHVHMLTHSHMLTCAHPHACTS